MRLSRITFVVTICLFIWGTVTYYIFLNRPPNVKDERKVVLESKLLNMEKDLRDQHKLYRDIVDKLADDIKIKKENSNPSHIETENVKPEFNGPIIPILVLACNRPTVGRCLDKLIEYRPNTDQFPIIVSQVRMIHLYLYTIDKKGHDCAIFLGLWR